MNQKKWILTAAAVLGLLLAVIASVALWQGLGHGYESARDMQTGQIEGKEPEAEEAGGLEGVSLSDSESSGAGAEKEAAQEATEAGTGAGESLEEEQSQEEAGPLRLVFAGDVLLSDHVLAAYERGGGIRGVVDEVLQSVIDSGDIFMVNQEFPFSDRGTAAADKQYTFRLSPEKVSMLQEMGIDIVSLANNHAMDFGREALLDTCDTLDKAGIYRVGAGKNLDEAKKAEILTVKGRKIGFLGASRVIPEGSWGATSSAAGMLITYDPAVLLQEIEKTKQECDYLIVYVHWGIERHDRPEEYQRTLGQQYIDAGADLVIGSHPHVLQGIEYYKGKPIVYSLGNFVFGSSIPKSMLLTADWDGENTSLHLIPAVSSAGYTTALTEEAKKQEFFQYISDLSYGVSVSSEGEVKPQPVQ